MLLEQMPPKPAAQSSNVHQFQIPYPHIEMIRDKTKRMHPPGARSFDLWSITKRAKSSAKGIILIHRRDYSETGLLLKSPTLATGAVRLSDGNT